MRTVVQDFIKEKNKLNQAITPIYLYSIQYDATANLWLRYCSGGTDITFDGVTYTRKAIKHNSIKENSSGMLDKIKIDIFNGDRIIQSYLDNYDGLKEKVCKITLVWREALDNPLCFLEHEYLIESASADEQTASLSLSSAFDTLDIMLPRRVFSRYRCQYAEFKDQDCGYSGAESSCDRRYETCDGYGNLARFGAFPGVPMPFNILVD